MTTASSSRQRLTRLAAAAALLTLYYVMAVSAASQKSMTFDELAHLTAGYSYWLYDDYRLHPENGNWPQRFGALPALTGGYSFPRLDQPAWTSSNVYAIGDQFLYSTGNDAETVLGRARATMALLSVALGALVFAWASRLVSPAGGWASLILFVFSPTLLAHGPLVTSDIAAALFFTAAAGAMWAALQRVTPITVLGAAVLVAGACLSKLSGPILVPVALVMLAVRLIDGRPLVVHFPGMGREYRERGRQLVVFAAVAVIIGLVVWALIWASFGFRYSAFAATTGNDAFLGQVNDELGIVGWMLWTARQFHVLPEAYLYGVGLTLQFASERAAFLNGEFSTTGWWWYFPYAFAVKTTIPGLAIGLLALAGVVTRWRQKQISASWSARAWASIYAGAPLLALVAVYWAFALSTNLNIGQRHLLPVYPALCILAGGAVYWIQLLFDRGAQPDAEPVRARGKQRSKPVARRPVSAVVKTAAVAVIVLLGWHVAESAIIRPDYLAYFNQLAGGPSQGYKHLADSSLDWGQDLPALKAWLDREGLQRPGASPVYLSYFGTARPEYYGIQATLLAGFVDRRPPRPPVPLGAGVYCISATVLDVIGTMFYQPEYETNYQAAMQNSEIFAQASRSEETLSALIRQTGDEYWRQLFSQGDQLRTGRLVTYLRRKQPDAMVGYSILIYRLTDKDVAAALKGPL